MNVLVPIDDSAPARAAIEHAAREYPEASISLLHVIDPNLSVYGDGGVYAYESVLKAKEEAAEELFDAVSEIAADHGHEGTLAAEIVVGNPAREIIAFADEGDYDHIVIGSHGRSGASRVLLGSVAERVTRRAGVPVTIVR